MATDGSLSDPARWRTIEHRPGRFSIACPGDWRVGKPALGAAVIAMSPSSGTGFPANMNVAYEETTDLSDAFDKHERSLPVLLTDLLVIDREERDIAGVPVRRLLVSYRQGAFDVTLEQRLVAAQDRFIVVSTSCESGAFDAETETLSRIADSFELSP